MIFTVVNIKISRFKGIKLQKSDILDSRSLVNLAQEFYGKIFLTLELTFCQKSGKFLIDASHA